MIQFASVPRLIAMFARLIAIALIRLAVARLLALAAVAITITQEWLLRLLHRNEARLLAEAREALAVVLAVVDHHVVGVARLLLRLILPELLLGRCDQPEIMLGVLIIVLGRHRVAGRARVARKLQIFFSDVRCRAADLDVGSVGLEHPGQGVLAAPIIIVIAAVAHPLVVLTVSHVLPLLFQPYV